MLVILFWAEMRFVVVAVPHQEFLLPFLHVKVLLLNVVFRCFLVLECLLLLELSFGIHLFLGAVELVSLLLPNHFQLI
jgi:hypothetical protein